LRYRAGLQRARVRPSSTGLVAAARFGLPGDPAAPQPAPRIGQVDIALASQDGLLGLLRASVNAGAVEADGVAAASVREQWLRAVATSTDIEGVIVRTAAVLDDHGVRWRLTKGAALAHLDYGPQPGVRTFRDMDLMIHPSDWTTAVAALTAAGHRRRTPEPAAGYDQRFGKGATLIEPGGLQADLHLRFAVGRFGVTSISEQLFEGHDSLLLGDRSIPTLNGPDRLLHACYHLVLGGDSGLRVTRDVVQLLTVTRVDWEATVETARRWRATAIVARAFVNAWDRLDLVDSHPAIDWAKATQIGRRDRRAMAVFEQERSFRRQALTAVSALPLSELPAFVRCHVGSHS